MSGSKNDSLPKRSKQANNSSSSSYILSHNSAAHEFLTPSQILANVMRNVDETLSWITEVHDKLTSIHAELDALSQLADARKLFHSTEDFFNDLSYQNMEIINLISQGQTSMPKISNASESRNLSKKLLTLKRDWESVKNRAAKTQTDVQSTLMSYEKGEIDTMGDRMTVIEDRIDKITAIPGNFELVKDHIKELRSLQDLLQSYQPKINDLGSAVILVDEAENFQDLEEELNLLGNRWAKICKWTEERWDLLQVIHQKWDLFYQMKENFSTWLDAQMSSVDELFQKSSGEDLTLAQAKEHFKQLKLLENVMETKQEEFAALGDVSAELCKYNENDESFVNVQNSIMQMASAWDILVQKMEDLGDQLGKSSLFTTKVTEQTLPREQVSEVTITSVHTQKVESVIEEESDEVVNVEAMKEFSERAVKVAYDLAVKELESSLSSSEAQTSEHTPNRVDAIVENSVVDTNPENDIETPVDSEPEKEVKETPPPEHCFSPTAMQLKDVCCESNSNIANCEIIDDGSQRSSLDAANRYSQLSIDMSSSFEAEKILNTSSGRETPKSELTEQVTEKEKERIKDVAKWIETITPEVNALSQCSNSAKSTKAVLENLMSDFDAKDIEIDWLPNADPDAIDVRERFSALRRIVRNKEIEVAAFTAQKQLLSELEILERLANETSEWINAQEPIGIEQGKIKLQLDQCQGKYWEVQKHRSKLDSLEETDLDAIEQNKDVLDPLTFKSIYSRLKHLKSSFDKSMLWLENRDKRLTVSLDNTPPQKYSDSLSDLTSFLAELKTKVESMGSHVVCDIAIMEENLQTCKALKRKASELSSSYDYVKTSFRDIAQRCSDQSKCEFLRSQNSEICDKWSRYTRKIDDKTAHIEKWLKVFKKFNEEVSGLNTWMDQVYMFLHSEEAALGDVATVTAQFEQSKALEEDISTIKPNLVTILEIGQQLIDRSAPKYGRKLRSSLDTLQKKWDKTVKLTKQQTAMLEVALDKSKLLEDSLNQLRSVLDEIKSSQVSLENFEVKTLDQIPQQVEQYSKIQETISKQEHLVKKIDSVYNEILKQDLMDGLEELMNRVNTVNEGWSAIKQHVEKSLENLSAAKENFVSFKTKIETRTDWLNEVEKVLERTPKLVVGDAEDLSEQLDSLDRVLDLEPESTDVINELATKLRDSAILVEEVQESVEKLEGLAKTIEEPAKQLRTTMQTNLKNVQTIQSDIIESQTWISETDKVIQEYIDAEVFSEKVPDEFAKVSEELEHYQQKIKSINQQFTQMTLNSSDRIQQQLNLLEQDMGKLEIKFVKFQKPASFEVKREEVVNKLSSVAHTLDCAEIKDWNEDYLQMYLDDHERLYSELSSLKPDVELVLKTGYSIIELGQTENPEKLDSELSDIKNQFNELGAQVTAGKGMFESAIKYSRRISANYIELIDWIEQTEKQLQTDSLNSQVEDLLYDLQLHEREMKNLLHDTDELLDLAEPHPLPSLEQMVESANQQFKTLAHKIADHVNRTVQNESKTASNTVSSKPAGTGPKPGFANSAVNSASVNASKSTSGGRSSIVSQSENVPESVATDTSTWFGLINVIRKWLIVADRELREVESPSEPKDDETKAIYDRLKKELKEQEGKKRGLKAMAAEAKANGDTRIDEEIKCFNSQFNNVSLRIHTAKETETKIPFVSRTLGPFDANAQIVSEEVPEPEDEATTEGSATKEPKAEPKDDKAKSDFVPNAMALAQEHLEVEQELTSLKSVVEEISQCCRVVLSEDENASFGSCSSNSSAEEMDLARQEISYKNLEKLEQHYSNAEPRLKDLFTRGAKVVSRMSKNNFSKSKSLQEKLEMFRAEWEAVKKQKNLVIEKQWYAFKREVQHFEIFLYELERKTKQTKGNLTKLKTIYPDFIQLKQDFAAINFKTRDLIAHGGSKEVEFLMNKLSEKWKYVESYFEWFDPQQYYQSDEQSAASANSTKNCVKEFMVEAYPIMNSITEINKELSSTDLFLSNQSNLSHQLSQLEILESKLSSIDSELKNIESISRSYGEGTCTEFEAREIERVFTRLKSDWSHSKRSFDIKKDHFEHCVNEVQVLSDFLKVLTAWATKTEAMFANTRLQTGKLNIQRAQIEQPILENELKTNAQVFTSLKTRYSDLTQMSTSLDTTFLNEKIEAFERRWKIIEEEINCRKTYMKDFQPTVEKFLKEIDSILSWVNKVNEFITQQPTTGEVEMMASHQEELKGYMKDLESINDRIQDINEMGKELISSSPSDLELIECKLRELNPRYVNISHAVMRSSHEMDTLLKLTKEYTDALNELEEWVPVAKRTLDDPALISDFTAMSDLKTVLTEKTNLVNIIKSYDNCQDLKGFETRSNKILRDVEDITHRINNSQPSNIELQSILRQTKLRDLEKEKVVQSGHDKFDTTIEEIRDWLIILKHLLKSEMVTVGDVNHIKNLISKQKQILTEPGMSLVDDDGEDGPGYSADESDELTKCLFGIQNGLQFVQGYLLNLHDGPGIPEPSGDDAKMSILSRLESIKKDWEDCREQVVDRCRHLEILLQASETFLNIYDNCRNDLCNTEYKLTHFGDIGYSSKVLRRQVAAQKVLKDEIKVLRKSVEALVRLANKIISDFSQDNTTRVREMRDSIYSNWKRVMKLSDDLDGELRRNMHEIDNLTRNANDLLYWMQEIELQIDVLALEVNTNDLVDNEAQYFQWQVQCKEFQLEIANHRGQWHSVESACQKGLKSLKPGDDFDISVAFLDELTIKWNSIKQKVKQIRQKLNINMEHCKQLISALTGLNTWVEQYLKETSEKSASQCGSLTEVEALYDKFIIDRGQISKKQKMIEANIDLGRQYVLELEDTYARVSADLELYSDRRGSIVSTASEDSPECVKEVVNNINTLINNLNTNWEDLARKLEVKGKEITETMKKYQVFTTSLNNLFRKVHEADNLRYRWVNVESITVEGVPEELEVIKNFESHLKALKETLDSLNADAKKLNVAAEEKKRVQTCSAKWNEVHVSTDQRKNKLKKLLSECGPNSQSHLANSVSAPWERTVAPNKVPFYINHKTESTQWDHPKYTDFMDSLVELNSVRFSAYRTAMKLMKLEAFLNFETIDLQQVQAALDKQDFKKLDGSSFIDVADIINCLNSLFQVVANKKKNQVKLSSLVDLTLNFILNVFDAPRNGKIRVLSLKTVLATLCRCSLEEKYKFLFKLVCPNAVSTTCTSADLGRLIHDIMQIPKQLGEIASFGGSNIEPSVKSCLSLSQNKNSIDMNTFLEWMKCEPQSLVWLPVLFRMQNAESARHQAKCNICKAFPITGFRYRYDLSMFRFLF